jgi:hypothetical protein
MPGAWTTPGTLCRTRTAGLFVPAVLLIGLPAPSGRRPPKRDAASEGSVTGPGG